MIKKIIILIWVLVTLICLFGSNKLQFYTDVFAWYPDGQWIFFYTDVNRRHRICKIPAKGGEAIPLPNDNFRLSHGPFADPNGKVLLVHAIKFGNFHGIWEIPLNDDPPRRLKPPGFEKIHHGHATRAKNGIITFDALRFKKSILRSYGGVKNET
jgi:hypothetical protein